MKKANTKTLKTVAKKEQLTKEKSSRGKGLKATHEVFVKAFVSNNFNATKAYMTAFGCSESVARRNASRLLTNADIKKAILHELEEAFEELEINPQKILEEIAKLAFCNMDDFTGINEDGTPFVDLSAVRGKRRKMAAVQELTSETYMEKTGDKENPIVTVKRVKLKLADKGINLERLGRYYKMFSDLTPSPDKTIKATLLKVQSGEMTPRDAAYHLQVNGLALPEILKIELSKDKEEGDGYDEGPTSEELDRRFLEGIANVEKEREHFVPARQAEVAAMKEEMKDVGSWRDGNIKLPKGEDYEEK